MKVKEYETYRAFYCTLCDTLSKRYGPFARMLLSYDAVFFLIFTISAEERLCCLKKGRCHLNPSRKCLKVQNTEKSILLAADLTVILFWFKLLDNIQDGGFFRSLFFRALIPFIYFKLRKAKRLQPELFNKTEAYFNAQYKAENDPRTGIDSAAEPSGRYFSYLSSVSVSGEQRQAFERFGYALGRYIYLSDAADDIEKDLKQNSFNPFIKKLSLTKENYLSEINSVFPVLELSAAETAEAVRSCPIKLYKPIIDNIIYLGLFEQLDRIIKKYEEARL